MLCERCKMREANIQYTEVINGVTKVHNFCMQCAKEMDFGQYSAIFDGDFPLAKLLSGILSEDSSQENQEFKNIVCPSCNTSYEEFVNNSRFGCPDCYEVFDLLIAENIKQLQGSDTHKGKKPKYNKEKTSENIAVDLKENASTKSEEKDNNKIQALQFKLNEAIRSEDYELAAVCRDKIRALQKGGELDA